MAKMKKTSEELVEEVLESAKETVKKAQATAKKATKKASATAKEAAKKADTVKEEAKKAVSKAAGAAKKPLKEEVYLQYLGKEINKDELVKQVKEIWTKQLGRKIGEIATLTLYLKPEENKAYYVINGEESGSVDL